MRSTAGDGVSCRTIAGNGGVVLALGGELDLAHMVEVRKALLGLELTRGDWLALDLRALTSMDSSSGVRPILQALQNAEQHGVELALICGPHAVQRMLELVGLAGRLRTVDDLTSLV
jgi:anti-anti-sigma factor